MQRRYVDCSKESNTKCMLCSKLLVAHVPHPNDFVYFHQRGIVNTLFGARCVLVCRPFLYRFESATDRRGGVGLHVKIQHTQHSIIKFLTCQMESLFNASNSVI